MAQLPRFSAWYEVVSGAPIMPASGLFRSVWVTRVTTAFGVAEVRVLSAVLRSRPPIESRSWVLYGKPRSWLETRSSFWYSELM